MYTATFTDERPTAIVRDEDGGEVSRSVLSSTSTMYLADEQGPLYKMGISVRISETCECGEKERKLDENNSSPDVLSKTPVDTRKPVNVTVSCKCCGKQDMFHVIERTRLQKVPFIQLRQDDQVILVHPEHFAEVISWLREAPNLARTDLTSSESEPIPKPNIDAVVLREDFFDAIQNWKLHAEPAPDVFILFQEHPRRGRMAIRMPCTQPEVNQIINEMKEKLKELNPQLPFTGI